MDRLNDNDDLKRVAPFLAGLPKEDPFVVPEGFFERFPHQVQAAITAQRPAPAVPWLWWKRLAFALPVVALAALGTWLITRDNGPTVAPHLAVTPLTSGELDALDDAEILAAFEETDAAALTSEDLGGVALQLNDEELLAYLEREDPDLTDLIETE